MKIGIEVQRLFRQQKFGIETSALQLLKKLKELNPRTQFVVYAKDDVDKACLQSSGNMQIKTLSGKVFFDFEHIFLPLATRQDRVDLLHCTGNTTPVFSPVPVVQTLHDVIFMDQIPTNDTLYQQFGNYYRRTMIPLTTRKSDAVITVSNYEKERILKKIRMDEKKIRVIYNGIDETRFRVITDPAFGNAVRARYNLPKRFMLFLGNTSARKNALRVIEAYTIYASRSKRPLPIVTPGLPKKYITDHLTNLGQSEKENLFVTPGYIADSDLNILYNICTMFLYPSLSEGFGMPLVEAMACGTPVITSNISCLPEIAGDAGILVDPTSARAISEAMTQLLAADGFRHEKIDQGIRNAQRFSWNKTAEQVFEVYEEVAYNRRFANQPAAKMNYGLH
jgi:glycosyltransferase involved in cell wall biosynthesis